MADFAESSTLLNEAALSGSQVAQPEPMEEEFELITDEFTLETLTSTVLELGGLILEEQWKRNIGDGSEFEQALVKHRAELQEGITQTKARMKFDEEKEAIVVEIREIPSIVVQEPESEDERRFSGVFEVSNPQDLETVGLASLEDLPEENDDFIITGFLSEDEANAAFKFLGPESLDQPRLDPSLQSKFCESDADFERQVSTSDDSTIGDHDVLLKSSEEPLSTFLQNVAETTEIKHSSALAGAARSTKNPPRGSKRGSDEAGLDEQAASKQVGAKQEEANSTSQAKRRQETGNRTTADPSKLLQVPQTPLKGKNHYKNMKGMAASRHSPRKRR